MNHYLSVVLAARNDNYGGDFEERLQTSLIWLDHLLNLYKLKAEIVIVDYNPVSNRPSLQQVLQINKNSIADYRLIHVPAAFHQKISEPGTRRQLPFYEYVAKNIGLRRSNGEFLLSANPDIIPDESIIHFIAQQKLNKGSYYRADRCDYRKGEPVTAGDWQTIRSRVFQVSTRGLDIPINSKITDWSILSYKFKSWRWCTKNIFYYNNQSWLKKLTNFNFIQDIAAFKMHSNASGDFMLMHRSSWDALRGHPENFYLPVHTDGLTVAMAKYSGLRELVFYYPVYHQEHERRFEKQTHDTDVEAMFRKFEEDSKLMAAKRAPLVYNQEDWGFAGEHFEETKL